MIIKSAAWNYETFYNSNHPERLAIARMSVPKMVKNGNKSLFTIRNRPCSPFGIHALKTDPTPEPRIKTIFHQLRNTHARSKFKSTFLSLVAFL